jgi:hypothetical protein
MKKYANIKSKENQTKILQGKIELKFIFVFRMK